MKLRKEINYSDSGEAHRLWHCMWEADNVYKQASELMNIHNWLTKQVLLNISTHFLITSLAPHFTSLVRENAIMYYFSTQNLLLHLTCYSVSSIFCFQRLYWFVRIGQILLGHLCNLCDWGLSIEWWLSEGSTARATAATPHRPQNVIRSRIGLIAFDSFHWLYGRCRPPTVLHLLVLM